MSNTVLLVDDDPNVLKSLQRAFHKEPFEVLGATSAVEAMMVMRRQPVDAIVSDEEMPGMHGMEFLSNVLEEYPDTVCFILSGRVTLEIALKAIKKGIRFFTKPADSVDISLAIRQGLKQKELLMQARRFLKIVNKQSTVIAQLAPPNSGINFKPQVDGNQDEDLDLGNDFDALLGNLRQTGEQAEGLLAQLGIKSI